MIIPIHKKKDKMDCNNYRGVSLLCHCSKVFSSVILQRIKMGTEEILSETQAGFRVGRGTVDQIFTLRQLAEKYEEYGKNPYVCYADFRQDAPQTTYIYADRQLPSSSIRTMAPPISTAYLLQFGICIKFYILKFAYLFYCCYAKTYMKFNYITWQRKNYIIVFIRPYRPLLMTSTTQRQGYGAANK